MKKIFLLIVLLGLCMALKPNSKKDEIVWSPNRKLTWKDFDKKLSKYAGELAIAYTGINFNCSKPFNGLSTKVSVYAFFLKSQSSKTSEASVLDNERLGHEQGHFDIKEWYARMFRKQILDTSFANLNQFYQIIAKKSRIVSKAANEEEDLYDKETNFANDTTMQTKWNKYIAEQLNAYAAYSQTEFVIRCGKK
ncbi:MAG TPA: hypothetical protein VNG53_03970 [Bacteroidia bacterium]|nr:hypothetical protein [Bacteroidia bacterium]